MAASEIIKHLYDGRMKLKDGTGTPVELEVPFSIGDFKASGLKQTQRNTAKYETRGVLRSVRHTSRTYITGSFTCYIADYSDATSQTVIDFLKKQGAYSANVSTRGSTEEVYTIDIILEVDGNSLGDPADHSFTLEDCECTFDLVEGEPNAITVNYECLGAHSFT